MFTLNFAEHPITARKQRVANFALHLKDRLKTTVTVFNLPVAARGLYPDDC